MSDSHAKHHDYHLVDPSPWPLLAAGAALTMAIGAIAFMRTRLDGAGVLGITGPYLFLAGFSLLMAFTFIMGIATTAGLQVVGPRFSEPYILAVAKFVEQANPLGLPSILSG